MRLGLISDTHGLVRPEAKSALQGVDRILHAGDVGKQSVLAELEEVAPVTAVRGNVDHHPKLMELPLAASLDVGEVTIHMLHILGELALDPLEQGVTAVVYGHSHQPSVEQRDDVWYINPGSAGPRRFRLPITLVMLKISGREMFPELIHLL